MILNDIPDTARLQNTVWHYAVRAAGGHHDQAQAIYWRQIRAGIQQALSILDANSRPEMQAQDQCNADSLASAMAEAAWFAICAVWGLQVTTGEAIMNMVDARKRIYTWAINHKQSINGTWQCQGCGRMFLEPGMQHSPCMM